MNYPFNWLIGRSLLGIAFLGPGLFHFISAINSQQQIMLAIAAVEIFAGLAFIIGKYLRGLTIAAAIFMVVDAFISHAFWNSAAQDQWNQALHFSKNIALAGGFILAMAVKAKSESNKSIDNTH